MIRVLLLLLLLPRLTFGFPANTTPLDTFTGSLDPLAGIWTDNVSGTGSGCKKVSGVATKVTGAPTDTGCYVTTPFNALQEVYVTMVNYSAWANGENGALLFCLQATGIGTSGVDGYALRFSKVSGTDRLETYKITNNSQVEFGADINFESGDGSIFGVEVTGLGTFDVWGKHSAGAWTNLATVTDASSPLDCTSSHIGINFRTGSFEMDDFGGGNVLTPSNPFIRLLIK